MDGLVEIPSKSISICHAGHRMKNLFCAVSAYERMWTRLMKNWWGRSVCSSVSAALTNLSSVLFQLFYWVSLVCMWMQSGCEIPYFIFIYCANSQQMLPRRTFQIEQVWPKLIYLVYTVFGCSHHYSSLNWVTSRALICRYRLCLHNMSF